jgi:hypothetical protein
MECVRPLLNGGVAPSKEACCAALDVLYKRWVQNGDNRAFQVFGVHFSPAVVTDVHRNLRDELARFAEVLREVGLLPRSGVIDGRTRLLWHTMQDRVDRIATALECHYQMWHCMQQLHQCRHLAYTMPSFATTPSIDASLTDWALAELRARGARRLGRRVMVPIPTSTGVASRAYAPLCAIERFVPLHLRKETEPELWAAWVRDGPRR